MGNKTNSNQFQSPANAMYNAIQQVLLTQVNTIITGIIDKVNDDGTYDVQPTLRYLNLQDNPTTPALITNVPASRKRFGNAEIKGMYKKDDAVILGVVQRDISILKKMWNKITNPNSYRKFNLSDAIILDCLANSPATTFVELKDNEINITASTITINGELIINDVPYANHKHKAGEYQAPNGAVTGTSGGLS